MAFIYFLPKYMLWLIILYSLALFLYWILLMILGILIFMSNAKCLLSCRNMNVASGRVEAMKEAGVELWSTMIIVSRNLSIVNIYLIIDNYDYMICFYMFMQVNINITIFILTIYHYCIILILLSMFTFYVYIWYLTILIIYIFIILFIHLYDIIYL